MQFNDLPCQCNTTSKVTHKNYITLDNRYLKIVCKYKLENLQINNKRASNCYKRDISTY